MAEQFTEITGSLQDFMTRQKVFFVGTAAADGRVNVSPCGYAVPLYDFVNERELLAQWAVKQGEERLVAYRRKNNSTSLDGKPTDIPAV